MTSGAVHWKRLEWAAVGLGAATLVVALVWHMTFQRWAIGTGPPRYDMFEPFLHPWDGLTWITQLVLWIAVFTRPWPWFPLVAIGVSAAAIQAWMGVGSAWIGVQDGQVSSLGALVGALSIAQLGLTLAWILLIVVSKRMRR